MKFYWKELVKSKTFREFRTTFPRATSSKILAALYARVPHGMAQFVPGRKKAGRWNGQSALGPMDGPMCDAEKYWHEQDSYYAMKIYPISISYTLKICHAQSRRSRWSQSKEGTLWARFLLTLEFIHVQLMLFWRCLHIYAHTKYILANISLSSSYSK